MTESDFFNLCDELQTNDSYHINSTEKIHYLYQFFREDGNQYLTRKLHKKSLDFISSLDTLRNFLARHFFIHPPKQTGDNWRLHLYPELKDKPTRYFNFQKRLDNHIAVALNKYKQYRSIIKKILYI